MGMKCDLEQSPRRWLFAVCQAGLCAARMIHPAHADCFPNSERSQKWHGGEAAKDNVLFDTISSYGAESLTVVKSQNVWFKLIFYSLFIYLFIFLSYFFFTRTFSLFSEKLNKQ